jgi:hypothetical protein
MNRFVNGTLHQVITEKGGLPVSFKWKGREYRVVEWLKQWQDFDYSALAPRRDWRTRRHRNYFHVRTGSGECFELYCDRGTKLGAKKQWILQTILEKEAIPREQRELEAGAEPRREYA